MGMFDDLICNAALPGDGRRFESYQTKSLDCSMSVYEITADGLLMHVSGAFADGVGQLMDFTGDIEFYNSNCCGTSAGVLFTRDGLESESVEYRARFFKGKLVEIIQTAHEITPALPIELMHVELPPDPEPVFDLREPSVGDEMFLQYGGCEGFSVVFLAKTQKQWAVAGADGDIETLHPNDLGCLLFHSQADADAWRANRIGHGNKRKAYYEELLAERAA